MCPEGDTPDASGAEAAPSRQERPGNLAVFPQNARPWQSRTSAMGGPALASRVRKPGRPSRCPSESWRVRRGPVAVPATQEFPKKPRRRPRAGSPAWHPGVRPDTRIREGSRVCHLRTRPSGSRNRLLHTAAPRPEPAPPRAVAPVHRVGASRRKRLETRPPYPEIQRLGSREGASDTTTRPTDHADETRRPARRTAPRGERASPAMGLDPWACGGASRRRPAAGSRRPIPRRRSTAPRADRPTRKCATRPRGWTRLAPDSNLPHDTLEVQAHPRVPPVTAPPPKRWPGLEVPAPKIHATNPEGQVMLLSDASPSTLSRTDENDYGILE